MDSDTGASMSAHTPAPWFVEDKVPSHYIGYRAIVDGDGYVICDPSPMGEANARLIAAAPDLLTALEVILRDYMAVHGAGDLEMQPALFQASAAIAKATGAADA